MDNRFDLALFNDGGNPYRDLLETFLKLPLGGTDEVFDLFSSLPGAIRCEGANSLERFVYIPGTRKDRVLLTAHADTFWDERYGMEPTEQDDLKFTIGIYCSSNVKHGLGADDRVGCAMLWGLRDCGHSILLTDGGEHGKLGALYLRKQHPKLFREINRTHRMILALDAPGSNCYRMDGVQNSDVFRLYVETKLDVTHGVMKGSCDMDVLCKQICGVNLGVGYVNPRHNTELFFVNGWNSLYRKLYDFLEEEHPCFKVSTKAKMVNRMPAIMQKVYRKLKTDGARATVAACLRRVKRMIRR